MVLYTYVLNTQQYKIRIKGKVEQSGAMQGKEQHFPLHLGVEAIEKRAFWSPLTTVANFTYLLTTTTTTNDNNNIEICNNNNNNNDNNYNNDGYAYHRRSTRNNPQ